MAPSTEMTAPDAQLVAVRRIEDETYDAEERTDKLSSQSQVPRVQSESNFSTSSTADLESVSDIGDIDVRVVNEMPTEVNALPPVAEARSSSGLVVVENEPEQINPKVIRRRSSILKHYLAEEIPVKEKGWRNLPKPDFNSIPKSQTSLGRAVSSETRVSFKSVEFRCHEQCAGDNPSVSIGTPISLDWEYEDMDPIDFEVYESQRENSRRNLRQMMMNYFQRRTLLNYRYGIPEEELDAAEKAANKIRHQRSVTRALLPTFLLEDMVTSVARKTKRALTKKNQNALPEAPIVPQRSPTPEVSV